MQNSLPFCKELYEVLTKDLKRINFCLTFAPNQPGVSERYFVSEEDQSIEIVCFTATFLSVFKESHEYFNLFKSRNCKYDQLPLYRDLTTNQRNLPIYQAATNLDTYYSTIGFLLTTPENKTALNTHVDSLIGLIKTECCDNENSSDLLQKEMTLTGRLLTSSNNRLNKSSSLWCLYRKLYILSKSYNMKIEDCVSIFMNSASRHFSSYYCWATARWFFDVIPQTEKEILVNATKRFCFHNFKDSSSWNALSYMICQQRTKSMFNIHDFERLQKNLGLTGDLLEKASWQHLNADSFFSEIMKFIDTVTIVEWPPFLCLLTIAKTFPEITVSRLLTNWRKDIKYFEATYGTIKYLRNTPLVPDGFCNDLVVVRTAKHLGYKKRLVECLQQTRLSRHS